MSFRTLTNVLGIFLTTSSVALAQIGGGGQLEMGAFGSFTKFDATIGAESQLGAGGWLGFYLSRHLSIEGIAGHTGSQSSIGGEQLRSTRVGGTVTGHLGTPIGSLYLGAGYARLFYRGIATREDDAAHAVIGDRIAFGGRAAFRIEGRLDYAPTSTLAGISARTINLSVAAGLSVFAFGGPPRDHDGDRVADKRDACPDTPFRAVVDADGCPLDTDTDEIFDGLDACPDTPTGAEVDANGCPVDSDGDSVFRGLDVCPGTPTGAVVDSNGCPLDTDEDGSANGLDQCPGTPLGAAVDDVGCPTDEDGDDVFDGLDRCPDTPRGVVVDQFGCVPDSDGDGVLDINDECADTAAGVEVDDMGCEMVYDGDGDGVLDPDDRCPGTAAGESVDEFGCPTLFFVEQGIARPLVLEGVSFASGRSALTPESHEVLDRVAASLLANPYVRIEIAGHTDATGSRAVNQRLSLARARAVEAYLADAGVPPDRMVARGYGPDDPVADNSTAEGRRRNRRVELHLIQEP